LISDTKIPTGDDDPNEFQEGGTTESLKLKRDGVFVGLISPTKTWKS